MKTFLDVVFWFVVAIVAFCVLGFLVGLVITAFVDAKGRKFEPGGVVPTSVQHAHLERGEIIVPPLRSRRLPMWLRVRLYLWKRRCG